MNVKLTETLEKNPVYRVRFKYLQLSRKAGNPGFIPSHRQNNESLYSSGFLFTKIHSQMRWWLRPVWNFLFNMFHHWYAFWFAKRWSLNKALALILRSTVYCIQWLLMSKRHDFANKNPYDQSYAISRSHVQIQELDHKGGWEPKNWCFQIVLLEESLKSALASKD